MNAAPSNELEPRKFHLSLNVADLSRSIAFYRVLFGVEPAKCRPDYAKFELPDPPVVLSLEPMRHAPGGALNHLGLRVPSSEAIVEMQARLESAGLPTRREDNVECCYARQTKFWCLDPDLNNWEIYVVEEDLDHKGNSPRPGAAGSAPAKAPGAATPTSPAPSAPLAPVVWEHRLGSAIPSRIPLADEAVDETLLRGSFNADVSPDALRALLQEARRALRPGGRVTVHTLVADRPIASRPSLPGPASAVQRIPTLAEPMRAVEEAGFVGLCFERLGASCCMRWEDVGLRESLITATKPAGSTFDLAQYVVYLGPMRQVSDDEGRVFERGVAVSVPQATAEALRSGPAAKQFAFLTPGDAPSADRHTA